MQVARNAIAMTIENRFLLMFSYPKRLLPFALRMQDE